MFAVNRFSMNKGTGIESGKWQFHPFMFADSLFGRATVEYSVRFGPVRSSKLVMIPGVTDPQIVDFSITDPQIVDAVITELVVVDDDGRDLEWINSPDETMQSIMNDMRQSVFLAFREQRREVLDFEMGLL